MTSDHDWPKVSIIIGGTPESVATRHTANSVGAGNYPGEIQLLTGSPGKEGSPASIANAHAVEAAGGLLMMLPPGATLDPRCLRRLVERLQVDERIPAVAPRWRGPDGAGLAPDSYSSVAPAIRPFLEDLGVGAGQPHLPLDLAPVGSMLTRSEEFLAVGGYDLTLDGTRYLGADLGRRLSESGGGIAIETEAVAFAPRSPDGLYRLPAYGLASRFGASAGPDKPPGPAKILWAAAHLPDRDRSGIDARHFEMIEALARTGAEILVWAEHYSGARPVGKDLSAAGIRWIAPPPDRRWDLGRRAGSDTWLRDLLGGIPWDTVVIAEPRLAAWITPQIEAIAAQARTVVDFGTVRFANPSSGSPAGEIGDVLPGLKGIDGVVVASATDVDVLDATAPDLPALVFTALGRESTAGAAPDGELLFVGDLFHHPNLLALEWWMDEIAGRVEAHLGRPARLRVVGHGADAHRAVWNHPAKVDIAGWQPDLSAELNQARLLVVPMTMVTGTGGRIASALGHGVPVVASVPAVAALPPNLAGLVDIGEDAADMARKIAHLMSDNDAWETARARIATVDIPRLREAQAATLGDWLDGIAPSPEAAGAAIRTRSSRRALRRRRRAS